MPPRCNDVDPGTREGLILVSLLPGTPAAEAALTDDTTRRRELAGFLRSRREALRPSEVGLPEGGRRRTPGLRREEVAALAGVGATWYTWLEQARDVRASREVLDAIADALRLTPAERRHLLLLGRGEDVPIEGPSDEVVSPTLRRLVENLGPNPAQVLGRRWDILAWNDAFATIMGDPAERPPEDRNSVWLLFTDPWRRQLASDWEHSARRVLARFRADAARHVGDPAFEAMVERLRAASPEARRWWKRHEVAGDDDGRKLLIHPEAGRMVFEHVVFRPGAAPEMRVTMYTPMPDEDTPAKLARLMAARARRVGVGV
jgi:transcriptional regulator with XRE-family HTH domain